MKLLDEFRLVICGLLFSLILKLAPKDNEEGLIIINTVHDWASKSIKVFNR